MRKTAVAGVSLWLDPAEAGGRYLAPILILPGLFQSPACWRGMTSMLAHRGWNVYVLPRSEDSNRTIGLRGDGGWEDCLATAVYVASNLDSKVIVFGADIGATMALGLVSEVRPLALGLFAPVEPSHAGRAYAASMGFFERRGIRGATLAAAPARLAKKAPRLSDPAPEPRPLLEDILRGVTADRPARHPPALVFSPEEDPLVDGAHAVTFAGSAHAKLARTRLAGRWWPSTRWEPIADEVHRFLILTLADRVVEFPDEVFDE